jgi:hypothetical protein
VYALMTMPAAGFEAGADAVSKEGRHGIAAMLGGRLRPRHRDRTLGFEVEERILLDGDVLYVVGQTRRELGDLVIGKPATRRFIVSRTSAVRITAVRD